MEGTKRRPGHVLKTTSALETLLQVFSAVEATDLEHGTAANNHLQAVVKEAVSFLASEERAKAMRAEEQSLGLQAKAVARPARPSTAPSASSPQGSLRLPPSEQEALPTPPWLTRPAEAKSRPPLPRPLLPLPGPAAPLVPGCAHCGWVEQHMLVCTWCDRRVCERHGQRIAGRSPGDMDRWQCCNGALPTCWQLHRWWQRSS